MQTTGLHIKAIVINYFCSEHTIELLQQIQSIQNKNKIRLSVACADNSNDADERRKLEAFKQQSELALTLSFNQQNLGFGKAINKVSKNSQFDFLWLVNPDITLFPNSLDELLSTAMTTPTQGIWGGLTVSADQQADYRHAWREPDLCNTAGWAFGLSKITNVPLWHNDYQNEARHNLTHAYAVDSISGCCALVSNNLWQKLNGFDEDFFLYSEEIDLCRRARAAGFQPTTVPTALLLHSAEGTSHNSQRLILIYHAKLLYFGKHHSLLYGLGFRGLLASGATIRGIAQVIRGNARVAKTWLTIAADALHLTSRSIKARYQEQH